MAEQRTSGAETAPAVDDHLEAGDAIDLDELTAVALAAAPHDPDDDARPWSPAGIGDGPELLPSWYMPVPQASGASPRRVVAAAVIIGALLVVNGVGLCVTYGVPEIAW